MARIKKPRADSKLKNLPDSDQEGLWLLMHPTDPETQAWTLDAVAVHIQETYQISVALSTLSEWHAWYALKRRMEMASQRANQTAIELAKNSDLSPEDIERAAQTVFTAEALQSGDVSAYVALAKLRLASRSLDHDARKLAILEAKAAKADEASKVMGDGSLSEEERAARMKEIFGF
jgi:hypothetical protein